MALRVMKIALPETGGIVSGPGEAEMVRIYETEPSISIIEQYENPALTAPSARGIWMLRSALDRGASTIIVSGIGSHAFEFLEGKGDLYIAAGMGIEEAVENFKSGKLPKLDHPNHQSDHSHNNEQ
ncbi:NifB/NifX family molybdenum-iron cluster-binding protein [Oxyplasma meridianum]|uniref:NifB/NifX family molybdenum-iron cluster-binding protein n=1 Tax=Oxyplasma meridianum TaxID=3073602 RepID=A0AAX4NHE1_9ARCH